MAMDPIYLRIRDRARQIVSRYPRADFYKNYPEARRISRNLFDTDEVIARLHRFVTTRLEEDLGHGLVHAVKVAIDAGTLVQIEAEQQGCAPDTIQNRIRTVQCAGLLHDIHRKYDNHAIIGACRARNILMKYPLSHPVIEEICLAIRNHEAFRETKTPATVKGTLTSDALYDADKFRWGPDNFTDTIWAMLSFYNPPLSSFIQTYPENMRSLAKIKNTFRTPTGKQYGPQFIDMGIAIGNELYQIIIDEFSEKD